MTSHNVYYVKYRRRLQRLLKALRALYGSELRIDYQPIDHPTMILPERRSKRREQPAAP